MLTSLLHSFGILLVEIVKICKFPKRQLEKQLESEVNGLKNKVGQLYGSTIMTILTQEGPPPAGSHLSMCPKGPSPLPVMEPVCSTSFCLECHNFVKYHTPSAHRLPCDWLAAPDIPSCLPYKDF